MNDGIGRYLAEWQRIYNRRRLAESAVGLVGYALCAAALVASLHVASLGSSPTVLVSFVAGLFVFGACAFAFIERRTGRLAIALKVDRARNLNDLMSSALAVERGEVNCEPDLGEAVKARAMREAPNLSMKGIGAFQFPRRPYMAAIIGGMVFASTYLWVDEDIPFDFPNAAAVASLNPSAAETDVPPEEEQTLEVTPETLEALRQDLEEMNALAERIAADATARESVDAIREQLGRATAEGATRSDAVGALSRAERELQALTSRAQDGQLMDPEELAQATDQELAEALREALEQGDAETASQLLRETASRTATADAEGLRELGEAVEASEGAFSESEMSDGDRRMAQEDRTAANTQLSEAGQEMARGDQQAALSELREMMESLSEQAESQGSPSEEALRSALSDVRSARSEQMAAVARAQSGQEGQASREGESREGQGSAQNGEPRQGEGQRGQGRGEGREGQGEGEGQARGDGQGEGEGRGQSPGEGRGDGQGDGQQEGISRAGRGDFGSGGTSPGPGQGPTPMPWEGPLPPLEMTASEWIESQWDGTPDGIINLIRSASHGERSTIPYRQLLYTYGEVADATARREDIPLTRRNYIREYFEAIRQ
jgi:hypothetical protein